MCKNGETCTGYEAYASKVKKAWQYKCQYSSSMATRHMTAMLQRFLTRQQVDAQAVLSPAEAHAVLAQQPFRVVLTDYFAPSGDGLILVRHIRQTVPGTRAILMAAFGAPELCHAALAEGAYACLAKPFRLQDLWAIVQPALQGLPAPAVSRRSDQGGPGQQPGEAMKSGDYGKDSGGTSVLSACGNSRMTVVPTPGVLSSCIDSLVTVDDLLTDRQAQSCAVLALGGIERLKDARQDLSGHAHARITKAQPHLAVCRPTGRNGEGATAWHGMPGIDQHIEEHLFELLSSAADERECRRHLLHDRNALVLETGL